MRAPELGRVKTRLAAGIGATAALRVYERLARHTVREALALSPTVAVRVHHTPTDAGSVTRWLGEGPEYLVQAAGGLGERLEQAFEQAFAAGFERVIVIGTDLPEMSAALLGEAFAQLDEAGAVLGPARDGGYYLLGLCAPLPELFRDIPWSTDAVFERTRERFRAAGLEPALLPVLNDVDEPADLPAGWVAEARR